VADGDAPIRLSLLYQLYLASTESRRFMRLALSETEMGGEEYGISSYFFANGPRTMSQAATDLGYPVTTLASMLAPMLERGELVRLAHPSDRRARLLELSPSGRERLQAAIPAFSAAYDALLTRLGGAGADTEAIFTALESLRAGIAETNQLLEAESGEHVRRRPKSTR
jgi:DNA-binding MarR family transcriptional regulator